MLVRKKYMVQKSFRISDEIDRDLNILAKMTDKSQNELVNVAIEELLKDNRYYFLKNSILEHFENQMGNGDLYLKPFEMGGLKVEMFYKNDIEVSTKATLTTEKEVVMEDEKSFESDICEDLENYLRYLTEYINYESDDTVAYLEDRLDYRDYISIKRK